MFLLFLRGLTVSSQEALCSICFVSLQVACEWREHYISGPEGRREGNKNTQNSGETRESHHTRGCYRDMLAVPQTILLSSWAHSWVTSLCCPCSQGTFVGHFWVGQSSSLFCPSPPTLPPLQLPSSPCLPDADAHGDFECHVPVMSELSSAGVPELTFGAEPASPACTTDE